MDSHSPTLLRFGTAAVRFIFSPPVEVQAAKRLIEALPKRFPERETHLQMLREEGVSGILFHALLVSCGPLPPIDRVSVVHDDFVTIGDVDSACRISGHVHFNDSVVIVQDVKMDVGEEVESEQRLLPLLHQLLGLPDEAPDGQVIIEHLHQNARALSTLPSLGQPS